MRASPVSGGLCLAIVLTLSSLSARATPSFTLFESGPVRPIALSPSGRTLFVCNIPDARLEVFRVTGKGLVHRGAVPVGLEPVASRRARTTRSGSSTTSPTASACVDADRRRGHSGRVVRTLLVGDEPRDIVFAGPGESAPSSPPPTAARTFPIDPQLTTPGVGRADVWVFDADDLGATLGGHAAHDHHPVHRHAARAGGDARTAPGSTRRRSTPATAPPTIIEPTVGQRQRGTARALTNHAGSAAAARPGSSSSSTARTGSTSSAAIWDDKVKFSLPDKDVFVIDANANPPAQLGAAGFLRGRRHRPLQHGGQPGERKGLRLEHRGAERRALRGPGRPSPGTPCAGTSHESRITVLGHRGQRRRRHLNKHIDYATLLRADPQRQENAPQPRAPAADGGHARRQHALRRGARLVQDRRLRHRPRSRTTRFTPEPGDQIQVSRRRPDRPGARRGRGRLYVLTRFDNAISVIDTDARAEIGTRRRCTTPSRRASSPGAGSSTTRRSPRATATPPAPAATSSATSTAWPGTSAIPTRI